MTREFGHSKGLMISFRFRDGTVELDVLKDKFKNSEKWLYLL